MVDTPIVQPQALTASALATIAEAPPSSQPAVQLDPKTSLVSAISSNPPDPKNCISDLMEVSQGLTNDRGIFRTHIPHAGTYIIFCPPNKEQSHAAYSSHIISVRESSDKLMHVVNLTPTPCRMNISIQTRQTKPNKFAGVSPALGNMLVAFIHLATRRRHVICLSGRRHDSIDASSMTTELLLPQGKYLSTVDARVFNLTSSSNVKVVYNIIEQVDKCHDRLLRSLIVSLQRHIRRKLEQRRRELIETEEKARREEEEEERRRFAQEKLRKVSDPSFFEINIFVCYVKMLLYMITNKYLHTHTNTYAYVHIRHIIYE